MPNSSSGRPKSVPPRRSSKEQGLIFNAKDRGQIKRIEGCFKENNKTPSSAEFVKVDSMVKTQADSQIRQSGQTFNNSKESTFVTLNSKDFDMIGKKDRSPVRILKGETETL